MMEWPRLASERLKAKGTPPCDDITATGQSFTRERAPAQALRVKREVSMAESGGPIINAKGSALIPRMK